MSVKVKVEIESSLGALHNITHYMKNMKVLYIIDTSAFNIHLVAQIDRLEDDLRVVA
jgi:hypothetical protein